MQHYGFFSSIRMPLLLSFVALLCACSAQVSPYAPSSNFEGDTFIKARRDVTPAQVVEKPRQYTGTLVAWVGEIENIDFNLSTPPAAARILLRHKSVDFNEYSSENDRFPSDRGSYGYFQAAWPIKGYADYENLRSLAPGTQMIAYGYPREVLGGVVGLFPAVYLRPLEGIQRFAQPRDPRESSFR